MENKLFISEREKEALANYLAGDFGKSDSEILNSWLEKHPKNKLLFDQFTDIWQASRYSKINNNTDVHSAWNELKDQLHQTRVIQYKWKSWLQIAAIILISLLTGGLGSYFLNEKQNPLQNLKRLNMLPHLGHVPL